MPGLLLQFFYFFDELRQDILSFICQFGKRFKIFDVFSQLRVQLNILFKPAPLLKDCLRLFLIIPEIRCSYLFFELGDFRTFVAGIKDTLELAVFFPRLRLPSPEVLRASIPPNLFMNGLSCGGIRQKSKTHTK